MVLALIGAGLLGLVIGSSLTVVVWRLPRGESLVTPGSHCPGCAAAVAPYDNIPVISWLVLRGHCRSCEGPIAARYPLVEAATGALYVAVVAARHEDPAQLALGLALVTLLVPMVLIDLDHRLIPNVLTGPFAVLALGIGFALDRGFVPEQLISGAAAGGFFLLAALGYPAGMGMGDVKLAGVLGLYLGRAVAPAVFIALIAGVAVGAVIVARKGTVEGRKTGVPFGPFLALGALVALFAGDALVDAYLGTF